ncbi:MAG: hypothetical protein EOM50_18780 [Erysipelotrichia bacterium]|nr:hypothetical protein [Erysipelotrichia bacterium]NCC54444.1 hypothetical protein [Erysipelotrichia bacterium]
MDRDECSCKAKGRLFVHIESEKETQVQIVLVEEHAYRDYYTVFLHDGKGNLLIDRISYGRLVLSSSIDDENTIYYPDHTILFQRNDYIHKVNIIDRRKKSDKL